MTVKMLSTYSKTKRPRGALLQLGIGLRFWLPRIGGRLRSCASGRSGVTSGIPLYQSFNSNPPLLRGWKKISKKIVSETFIGYIISTYPHLIRIMWVLCNVCRDSDIAATLSIFLTMHFLFSYQRGNSAWWVVWLGRSPPKWQRRRLQRLVRSGWKSDW